MRREHASQQARRQAAVMKASVEKEMRQLATASAQEAERTRQAAQAALETVRGLQEEGRRASSRVVNLVS